MTRLAIRGDANTTMEITPTENGVSLFINGVTLIVVNTVDGKPLQIAGPQKRLAIDGPSKNLKHVAAGKKWNANDVQPANLPPGTTYVHGKVDVAAERFLIDGLIELGPVRVGRLLDHLGIDPKDPRRRQSTQRLDRMRSRGIVAKHPQDKNKRTDFRLVVPNPRVYLTETEGQ